MSTFWGMDPEEVTAFAEDCLRGVEEMRDLAERLTRLIMIVTWNGADAEEFRENAQQVINGQVNAQADDLAAIVEELRREAEQQEMASGGEGSNTWQDNLATVANGTGTRLRVGGPAPLPFGPIKLPEFGPIEPYPIGGPPIQMDREQVEELREFGEKAWQDVKTGVTGLGVEIGKKTNELREGVKQWWEESAEPVLSDPDLRPYLYDSGAQLGADIGNTGAEFSGNTAGPRLMGAGYDKPVETTPVSPMGTTPHVPSNERVSMLARAPR